MTRDGEEEVSKEGCVRVSQLRKAAEPEESEVAGAKGLGIQADGLNPLS